MPDDLDQRTGDMEHEIEQLRITLALTEQERRWYRTEVERLRAELARYHLTDKAYTAIKTQP